MKTRRLFFALASGLLLASGNTTGATLSGEIGRTSQLIVKLSAYDSSARQLGISDARMRQLQSAAGFKLALRRSMSGGARVFALPVEMTTEDAALIADRLQDLPWVEAAVPDRVMFPTMREDAAVRPSIPDDPRFRAQWHYYDKVSGINLVRARSYTIGSPDIHVAVIDTGIRGGHEDLAGQWAGGYDFISGNFNARDGDGRDADPADPGDYFRGYASSWHGSHVAGTIGAATDNGTGVAGIAPGTTLQPIRVLGPLGGFTSDIVDGMRWAAGISVAGIADNPNPARVMNLSLGGTGPCDAIWQSAIDDVTGEGSTIVVAAGNEESNASGFTPASCDGVITVGAVDRSGDLAWYSNWGADVEISAPGGDTSTPRGGVLSTIDAGDREPSGDDYAYYQGTSMAAPHVAGAIALMLSINPDLTPARILGLLRWSARDFPAGSDCESTPTRCGAGILDAGRAATIVTYLLGN